MEIVFDTETDLIIPGGRPPKLVVFGWKEPKSRHVELLHGKFDRTQILDLVYEAFEEGVVYAHNLAFDLSVLCRYDPGLVPVIFRAAKEDRLRCTMVGSKLFANAEGWRGDNGVSFSLEAIFQRFTGRTLVKNQLIRTSYGDLYDVPITDWSPEEIEYVTLDVHAHDSVREHLVWSRDRSSLRDALALPVALSDETWGRWSRIAWAHQLTNSYGPRCDWSTVVELRQAFGKYFDDLHEELNQITVKVPDKDDGEIIESPLVRADGSKDMRAIRQFVLDAYAPDSPPVTDKGKEILTGQVDGEFDPLSHTSTDRRTMLQAGNETCVKIAEFVSASKVIGSYINNMMKGTTRPLDVAYDSPLVTGRSSSFGDLNIQNQPRKATVIVNGLEVEYDVRNAFVPRPGHVFIACDYDSIEVRTLGQAIKDMIGWSTIADAYCADPDFDPHAWLGASLMGKSFDDFQTLLRAKDKDAKDMRQLAKVPNFGYPGGMGPRTLIEYAYATYGLVLSYQEAVHLKKMWEQAWPDAALYLKYIGTAFSTLPPGEDRLLVWTDRTQFVRGGCTYCAAANHRFQSLAAHVAQEALFRVYEECYTKRDSPLFNCRPFAFIHDEIILESPYDQYKEAAKRLAEVMIEDPDGYMEDVPLRAGPYAMARWIKNADAIYDDNGELLVYGEAA